MQFFKKQFVAQFGHMTFSDKKTSLIFYIFCCTKWTRLLVNDANWPQPIAVNGPNSNLNTGGLLNTLNSITNNKWLPEKKSSYTKDFGSFIGRFRPRAHGITGNVSINFTIKYLAKGQMKSECIYEIIDFPKYHWKNLIDFCPGRFYRLGTYVDCCAPLLICIAHYWEKVCQRK